MTLHKEIPIILDKDTILKQERAYKEDFSPFSMISPIHTIDNKTELDIFDLLVQLSKGAFKLFIELKSRMAFEDNLLRYPKNGWTRSQQVMFGKLLKELVELNIVKRVKNTPYLNSIGPVFKKHSFMINPHLIKCRKYTHAKQVWENLK